MIEEQLHKMQQNQRRKERVQVHIERVAPLDVRINLAAPQIPIGERPHERRDDNAAQQKVDHHHVEQEIDALADAQIQCPGESDGRDYGEDRFNDD